MQKCLLLYNPHGGKGKFEKYKTQILQSLSTCFSKVDVVATQYAGHATQVATAACGVYDCLVVAGGDGTLHEVVNGIAQQPQQPILGILPCGTVNDVARSLSIPANLRKAVEVIAQGNVLAHDIFKFNNTYGIYVFCAGVFTDASYQTKQSAKRKIGKLAYVSYGLQQLFHAKPVRVCLQTEDVCLKENVALMLVINSKSVAGIRLHRMAQVDDGEVDVLLVKSQAKSEQLSLKDILHSMQVFTKGVLRSGKSKHVVHVKMSQGYFSIQNGTINIDGEKVEDTEGEFRVIKQGVRIYTPNKKEVKYE